MLNDNITRFSKSARLYSIQIVPKRLHVSSKLKWCIVIDYRKLNDKTIGNKYPITNITDSLDILRSWQYFSTIDLVLGFHQI